MVFCRWQLVVAVLFFATPGIAVAADLEPSSPPPSPMAVKAPAEVSYWVVTIGGEIRRRPRVAGRAQHGLRPGRLPLFSISASPAIHRFFSAPATALGFLCLILASSRLARSGRCPGRVTSTRGARSMGSPTSIGRCSLGVYAQYWATPWLRIRAEARQGVGGETGQSGDLYVDAVVPVGQFRLSGGPRLALQSANADIALFQHHRRASRYLRIAGL